MKRKGLNKLLAVIVSASMILGTGIVSFADGYDIPWVWEKTADGHRGSFSPEEGIIWYTQNGGSDYVVNPSETPALASHEYDDDNTCICGYVRQVGPCTSGHTIYSDWISCETDDEGHYYITQCGNIECGATLYSVDKENWSKTQPTKAQYAKHTMENERWVAVSGLNGHRMKANCSVCELVMYSIDGENWTSIESKIIPEAHTEDAAEIYYYSSTDFDGHKKHAKCSKCSVDMYSSDGVEWYLSESQVAPEAHDFTGDDPDICKLCHAPSSNHVHTGTCTSDGLRYNATSHWYVTSCTCSHIIASVDGEKWVTYTTVGIPSVTAPHEYGADNKCYTCGYTKDSFECPVNSNFSAGHYEHDAEGHWFVAPCDCGAHDVYLILDSDTFEWSKELHKYNHYNLSPVAGTTCDACGYTRPAPAENKDESKEEVKKDDAVTVAASVVEATTTVSADTVTLTPAIENALVQASVNDTAAPVVIDMTVASEIPATLAEKIAESEATVNLTLDTGVVLGLTSDTLEGTTAAPIVVKTVEPKMVVNLLTTTTNVPADKKLVVMNPVKGATMNNTAVIYQFYGPEAAGQVVNFYAADATGKFGVLATSVVFPNGYAAFVVPVVGFVGYAQ